MDFSFREKMDVEVGAVAMDEVEDSVEVELDRLAWNEAA
jgi:hypothetical protein